MKNGMLERYVDVREAIISQIKKSPTIAPTGIGEFRENKIRENLSVCMLSHGQEKRNLDLAHVHFNYLKDQLNNILSQLEKMGVNVFDNQDFSRNEGYALDCVYFSDDANKLLFSTKHVNMEESM